jgi:UMF1 family MFS transporter
MDNDSTTANLGSQQTIVVTEAVNDRKEIFGWIVYDWANSAYYTTVVSTLFGPHLTRLAQTAVGINGTILSLGFLGTITAESLFPFCVSAAVFIQIFLLPPLGALADYSRLKKNLMILFCYVAVAATCLLFFVTENLYLISALLFIISKVGFGATMVFYNAFLPEIASQDKRDKVSSYGFALGYLGGGLLLLFNLLLVYYAPRLNLTTGMAVRLSLLSAGVWWGGFSIITFIYLKSRESVNKLPSAGNYLTMGFKELGKTFRELKSLRQTWRFLLAYLMYNDGIQTVISQASVFLAQELFIARGHEANQSFLIGILLLVQFVAIGGALAFERIANFIGTKNAVVFSLALWSGVVIYAYSFLQTAAQAWGLSVAIALILGGSQALSRSLYSLMIPKGREAAFFSLYEISERGTSWIGPLVFGIIVASTGSYRHAILSLIVFFVAGMVILILTDVSKAVREAANRLPYKSVSG